jgi:Tfp pilus assembly protein PilX
LPPLNTFTDIANNAAEAAIKAGEIPYNVATVYATQKWAGLIQEYYATGETTEFLTRAAGVCAQHAAWCEGVSIPLTGGGTFQ